MFLVGLTGGIATGKSTVSSILKDLGCPVIDADQIAREVVLPGKPALEEIRKAFGNDVINKDGSLNRELLGQIAFAEPVRLKILNSITHPKIYKAMLWELLCYFMKGEQFVIMDLPLLFETSKMTKYLTSTVVVYCDPETQLMRLRKRNNYTEEEALQRINAQMSLDEKCLRATDIVYNSGSVDETRIQVEELYNRLRRNKAHWKLRLLCVFGVTVIVSGVYMLGSGIWQAIQWTLVYS